MNFSQPTFSLEDEARFVMEGEGAVNLQVDSVVRDGQVVNTSSEGKPHLSYTPSPLPSLLPPSPSSFSPRLFSCVPLFLLLARLLLLWRAQHLF